MRGLRRRARLAHSDPALRLLPLRRSWLCGRVVAQYSAEDVAAEDLDLITGMLRRAGVPYFAVPTDDAGHPALGVEHAYRTTVLGLAAQELRGTCAYVGAVTGPGPASPVAMWADARLPRPIREAGTIRVGTVRLGPAGQELSGLEAGCDIEFWRRGAETDPASDRSGTWLTVPGRRLGDPFLDALVAPRPNPVSEVVPVDAQKPTTVRAWRHELQTFEAFAAPRIETVRFPVDAVYTWVDGDDPVLAALREAHRGEIEQGLAERETGAARYAQHDELRYALRSLEMYAGFFRHVFLLTDGQAPSWLDPHAPGLTVVDHRDILPAGALPVFNSHAIESRLHRIPGLAEHFVYFNDDVFINRPVGVGTFFHGNGIARVPLSTLKIGLGPPWPLEPAPNAAAKNVRELILRTHGVCITHKAQHAPHPQLRSVMRELDRVAGRELRRTTYARFRSTADLAPATALHHHWALVSGLAVPCEYRCRYIDVGRPDLRVRLARLRRGEDVDFFCLNDVDTDPARYADVGAALHAFLDWKFPFPSRAESPQRTPARAAP